MKGNDETIHRKKQPIPLLVIGGGLIVLILLASWAPDSRMTELRWVPSWLAALADRDPNIRTAIPFILLAFLMMAAFPVRGCKWSLVWTLVARGACLGLSELGQVFLPGRTADVWDLIWGGKGSAVGAGLERVCGVLLAQARADDKVGQGDATP